MYGRDGVDLPDFEAYFVLAIRHGMRLLTDLTPGRSKAGEAGLPGGLCYFTARYGNRQVPMIVVPPGTDVAGLPMFEASAEWMTAAGCGAPLMLMLPADSVEGWNAELPDGQLQAFAYSLDPPSFKRLP